MGKKELKKTKDAVLKVEESKSLIIIENSKKSLFLQLFGDHPKSRILDFLIDNKGLSFSKTEISRGAKVFKTAFFKQNQKRHHYDYFGDLVRLGVVAPVAVSGLYPEYTLNTKNKVVRALLKVELALIEQSMKQELQKCAKDGVEINW